MPNILELLEQLKHVSGSAGKLGSEMGQSLSKFGHAHPKTSAAIGGSAGTLALQKILGKRPETDADEQEQRMRMLQQYGG